MIIQHCKAFVTEPLIKRASLKLVCSECGVFTTAYTGFGFGDPHEFRAVTMSAILGVNPENSYMKPARYSFANQTTLDLASVGSQEDVNWLGSIRDTRHIEVEPVQRFFNELDILSCGSWL